MLSIMTINALHTTPQICVDKKIVPTLTTLISTHTELIQSNLPDINVQ